MLGREFLANDAWEFFPLTDTSVLAGILVDASISISGGKYTVELTSLKSVSGVLNFIISLPEISASFDSSNVSHIVTRTQSVFGEYTILNVVLAATASIKEWEVTLVFVSSTLDTNFDYTIEIPFCINVIQDIHKVVTSINTAVGNLEIIANNGLQLDIKDGVITIERDATNPCPSPCPAAPVKTINGNLLGSENVNLQGIGYVITPGVNQLTVTNHLTSCCDCEDQHYIWEAYVDQVREYNSLIENLNLLETIYLEITAKLDLLITAEPENCNRWNQLRQLYFPDGLFCRI